MGLTIGIWMAVEVPTNAFLTFLQVATFPIGIGLLCSPIFKNSFYAPRPFQDR
jgi:hypothetical protein